MHETIASLGYRTCPEYTIGYINYISLWNQTDSKSYISVIGYSRGNKTLYNKILYVFILMYFQAYKQRYYPYFQMLCTEPVCLLPTDWW